MQLIKKLKTISLSNECHLYALLMLLIVLSIHSLWILIPLLLVLYKLRKSIHVGLLLLILCLYGLQVLSSCTIPTDINGEVFILERSKLTKGYQYTVGYNLKKYQMYAYQTYNPGTILTIKAQVTPFKHERVPGGFDERNYKLSLEIYGELSNISIQKEHTNHILYNVYSLINWNSPIILFFKDVSFSNLKTFGFLFSLSSIHLTFLIFLIYKLMYYLDIEEVRKHKYISVMMFLCYLIGESTIVLKFGIYYGISYINLRHERILTKLDIESLTFITMIILRPNITYSHSWVILMMFTVFNELKVIKKSLSGIVLGPLILSPFMLLWEHQINVLNFLFIPTILLFVKYLFVPSLLILTIIPWFSNLSWFNDMDQYLIWVDHLKLNIYLGIPNFNTLLIYYGLIIFLYASINYRQYAKRLCILLCIIVIYASTSFLLSQDEVMFLDCGQGDSAVIVVNNKVIVVDAYGEILSYLTYKQYRTIDYLILTHNDLDHIKEAQNLIDNLTIRKVIVSGYMNYPITHPNITPITHNNLGPLDDLPITIIGPLCPYDNVNDASIVFKLEFHQQSFLFTGDISTHVESHLIETYGNLLDSDILKSPHHGSKTSSSFKFLELVSPKDVVISVAEKNSYGLPDLEVIQRYHSLGIHVYLTSQDGSILYTEKEVRIFS